jgi:hypothetical protein
VDPETVALDEQFAQWFDADDAAPPDPITTKQLRGLYRNFTTGINQFSTDKHNDWLCIGTFGTYREQSYLEDRPGSTVINEILALIRRFSKNFPIGRYQTATTISMSDIAWLNWQKKLAVCHIVSSY